MTIGQFIEAFVKIEEINPNQFGYHPFHMISIDNENKMSVHCLVGHRSEQCYAALKAEWKSGCNNVIMACDFPQAFDIESDFVLVFQILDGAVNYRVIPYNKRGEIKEPKKESYDIVNQIMMQFDYFLRR
ncbi:hypothetical protein LV89_02012 [Arcicella aurantiaca]|uniref:Uncharacterized protein n=1 Tax=Arcicella aurantiaca TaxID=591202 RepID=A0A316E9X5_9BACT|nr:hypothetical protein [Arcicella aurantiaca]PWK27197.1 hypothetical protein LV89_02012 [Arcicella aurantiaca]